MLTLVSWAMNVKPITGGPHCTSSTALRNTLVFVICRAAISTGLILRGDSQSSRRSHIGLVSGPTRRAFVSVILAGSLPRLIGADVPAFPPVEV